MAAVTQRHTAALGPVKVEFIIIDAETETLLANVETLLAHPFACNIFEVSHTDDTTNDSQTKAGTPLAVFSAAAPPASRLIDTSGLTATKFYCLWVLGF